MPKVPGAGSRWDGLVQPKPVTKPKTGIFNGLDNAESNQENTMEEMRGPACKQREAAARLGKPKRGRGCEGRDDSWFSSVQGLNGWGLRLNSQTDRAFFKLMQAAAGMKTASGNLPFRVDFQRIGCHGWTGGLHLATGMRFGNLGISLGGCV